LTYAVWGDNNFVKTLSNFHSPVILRGGIPKPREESGILVMLTVQLNKRPTARLIIRLIKEMGVKAVKI
jgi:hypothetical protein